MIASLTTRLDHRRWCCHWHPRRDHDDHHWHRRDRYAHRLGLGQRQRRHHWHRRRRWIWLDPHWGCSDGHRWQRRSRCSRPGGPAGAVNSLCEGTCVTTVMDYAPWPSILQCQVNEVIPQHVRGARMRLRTRFSFLIIVYGRTSARRLYCVESSEDFNCQDRDRSNCYHAPTGHIPSPGGKVAASMVSSPFARSIASGVRNRPFHI